jgi:hypothetical protein
VEAANIALATGQLGEQQGLAELIMERAKSARQAQPARPPALYRWVAPDPLLACAVLANLLAALLIASGFHAG